MRQIFIFGTLVTTLVSSAALADGAAAPRVLPQRPAGVAGTHAITGIIRAMTATSLVLQLRDGKTLRVDISRAIRGDRVTDLFITRPVQAYGFFSSGTLEATAVQRARDNPAAWAPDS